MAQEAKPLDWDCEPRDGNYGIIVYMDDDTEVWVEEEVLVMAGAEGPTPDPEAANYYDWECVDLEAVMVELKK